MRLPRRSSGSDALIETAALVGMGLLFGIALCRMVWG